MLAFRANDKVLDARALNVAFRLQKKRTAGYISNSNRAALCGGCPFLR
jgi:hypothetical protein